MSPNEEMTQASRPKRPAAGTAVSSAAAAAGTRLRRPAPSKDIEAGPQQQKRRAAPAEAVSDRSDDTGIDATDNTAGDPAGAMAVPETAGKRDKRAAAKSSKTELASAKSSKTAADKASDSDDVAPVPKATKPSGKSGTASKAATATKAGGRTAASEEPARTRPTNNQLLYKARFNWDHYPHPMIPGARETLPDETHGCASVTSAFLQVLKAIHTAELSRRDGGRNVLKLLSVNTRRTKVVALSTGTHRVPDELRRHQLADEEGNEYSTNLDRNRYGNDDQYLFTVIKFNLEALGLCPLIAQVEIIDAKAAKEECVLVVKVPDAGCACDGNCVNGVRDGVHVAAREIVGGSAAQRESVARSNEQSARRARESGSGGAKSGDAKTPRANQTKEQWRVPTTPMSPMKRNASAGDAGGMGMLLDALTQVGGMPPPSPLHLRSPPHGANVAGRRASFLSGGANMAAASPSMRPAAAAMSALCASAPPSVDRDAVSHMGGVGGVAQAAAAAAAAAQYYGLAAAGQSNAQAQLLAIQQHHEQQQLLFQSPPLMQKFAAAAAGLAPAPGNCANDFSVRRATPETLANESVLEELVERERGEAAAARAAEAKANARVAELERELAELSKKDEEDASTEEDGAAKAKAEKAERTAEAVAREDFAHRLVALEEEIAAFGARAEAAARNAGTAPAGGDAMTALYVAEARAHARALVRVARLEATAALASSKGENAEENASREETIARAKEEAGPEEGAALEASPGEPDGGDPESPAASPAVENVASLAAAAEAEKRARDDDAGFFEPPPPAKRRATETDAVKAATKAAAAAAAAGAVGTGYAPPTTPALADNGVNGRDGVLSPDQPAQALHFAAAAR